MAGSAEQRRNRSPSRAIAGVVLFLASAYLGFAAVVLLIVGLTDVTGFVTDARSVALFVALAVAAVSLGRLGAHVFAGGPRDTT